MTNYIDIIAGIVLFLATIRLLYEHDQNRKSIKRIDANMAYLRDSQRFISIDLRDDEESRQKEIKKLQGQIRDFAVTVHQYLHNKKKNTKKSKTIKF